MRNRSVFILLLIILLPAFYGCIIDISLANAANVLTFSVEGQVGLADIDSETHSITVLLEPMDISDAVCAVTVSDGAFCESPVLADGVPVVFTVTAENGEEVDWTVTSTVQFGISFTLDGTRRVLTAGYTDSTNALSTEALCNNDPVAFSLISGRLSILANETTEDFFAMEETEYAALRIWDDSPYVNWYNSDLGDSLEMEYTEEYVSASDYVSYYADENIDIFDLIVSEDQGGVCSGLFSATLEQDDSGVPGGSFDAEDGFFKVKWMDLSGLGGSGSSEADVTSFSATGQTEAAVIDTDAKTITLTLEPMDAADAVCTIEVSEEATFDTPVLEDGVPVSFTVTAEDGTEVDWIVTAAVQYGIKFSVNGTDVILNYGIEDSSGTYTAAQLGNGLPIAYQSTAYSNALMFSASSEVRDINSTGPDTMGIVIGDFSPPYETSYSVTNDIGTDMLLTYLSDYQAGDDSFHFSWSSYEIDTTASFTSLAITTTNGDVCTGAFTVEVEENDDTVITGPYTMTGYFKLSWINLPF